MRKSIIIGFGCTLAVIVGSSIYLTRSSDLNPPTSTASVSPPADTPETNSLVTEPERGAPRSASPRENFSTGFAESTTKQHLNRESLSGFEEAEYVQLVRSLRLSAEDSERLLNILADESKRIRDWLAASRRSFISQDETNDLRAESNRLARELLGDVKYQQYDDYRKHPDERREINRISEQLVRNESRALSQEQDDQLFAAIKEEAGKTPPPLASAYDSRGEYQTALKKWRDENMKRFRERASTLFTADQLAALKEATTR